MCVCIHVHVCVCVCVCEWLFVRVCPLCVCVHSLALPSSFCLCHCVRSVCRSVFVFTSLWHCPPSLSRSLALSLLPLSLSPTHLSLPPLAACLAVYLSPTSSMSSQLLTSVLFTLTQWLLCCSQLGYKTSIVWINICGGSPLGISILTIFHILPLSFYHKDLPLIFWADVSI